MYLLRISLGRLFHSRGPATEKLLSPICDCVHGTTHVHKTSEDLRCRRPCRVDSRSDDAMIYKQAPPYLKPIICFSGNQWSLSVQEKVPLKSIVSATASACLSRYVSSVRPRRCDWRIQRAQI